MINYLLEVQKFFEDIKLYANCDEVSFKFGDPFHQDNLCIYMYWRKEDFNFFLRIPESAIEKPDPHFLDYVMSLVNSEKNKSGLF